MGGTDRVDILCAAHLERPGLTRWSTCRLTVAAISRGGTLEVNASATEGSYNSRSVSWSLSSRPKTETEAAAEVKAIAEHHGLKMPSFFGYMGYSLVVLMPTFLIVTAIFFL